MFKPLNGRILVKPNAKPKASEFGIILPDSDEKPVTGEVIVGSKNIKTGEHILFSKFGFDEVTIDKELYYVISEACVLGIF